MCESRLQYIQRTEPKPSGRDIELGAPNLDAGRAWDPRSTVLDERDPGEKACEPRMFEIGSPKRKTGDGIAVQEHASSITSSCYCSSISHCRAARYMLTFNIEKVAGLTGESSGANRGQIVQNSICQRHKNCFCGVHE